MNVRAHTKTPQELLLGSAPLEQASTRQVSAAG